LTLPFIKSLRCIGAYLTDKDDNTFAFGI